MLFRSILQHLEHRHSCSRENGVDWRTVASKRLDAQTKPVHMPIINCLHQASPYLKSFEKERITSNAAALTSPSDWLHDATVDVSEENRFIVVYGLL